MKQVFLKFERRAEVLEVGGVSVIIQEDEGEEEAIKRAMDGEVVDIITTDRDYVNESWHFGPFDAEGDENDEQFSEA